MSHVERLNNHRAKHSQCHDVGSPELLKACWQKGDVIVRQVAVREFSANENNSQAHV